MHYICAMRAIQPDGPYVLVGYSFGCRVATAMCLLLQTLRLDVRRLVLIDGPITGPVVDLGTRPDLFATYLAISQNGANPPSLLEFVTAHAHVQGGLEDERFEQYRPAFISPDRWREEIGRALTQTRHCVHLAEHHMLDCQQQVRRPTRALAVWGFPCVGHGVMIGLCSFRWRLMRCFSVLAADGVATPFKRPTRGTAASRSS